ncbi:T9SS type A sorting domain-containing protein [Prolixibacteraceae bacterium JC049]|nr:T9SS type A sorting domain-containing protein [Prolixibacteraceae bacterium JC049]
MKRLNIFCISIILLIGHHLAIGQTTHHWETVFYSDTIFHYFSSNDGTPDSNWRLLDFDANAWKKGKGGIGYGDNDDSTTIAPCTAIFLRREFEIKEKDAITEALLHMDYDDAFVAYLNGTEVARSAGLKDAFPAITTVSTTSHEARMYKKQKPEEFHIKVEQLQSILLQGKNVLAIQVHNTSSSSSDMSSNSFFSVGINSNKSFFKATPNWFKAPFQFSGSKLPLLVINTNGQTIVDEPKIPADLKFIHNSSNSVNKVTDTPNIYDGRIGIERRGSSSFNYPQRPYLFETQDENGDNNDVEILGMPKENDWILLSHYNDKTLMRNMLSFDLFREMGNYSVRSRLCDVVLNDKYEGIYLLCEKVKRDKNRVNVNKLKEDEIEGDDLTGGYIFKVDYHKGYDGWVSKYSPIDHPDYTTKFVFHYPDHDDIAQQQKSYISTHVDKFQKALHDNDFQYKYESYIDLKSFIDYFLLNELARNVDGFKKSRYFHKDKDSDGGKIKAGPVWDFDWAWKNIKDCHIFRNTDGSGWAYKINDCYKTACPGWYVRLLEDPVFANRVHCRYKALRKSVFSDERISFKIDSIYNLVKTPQIAHFNRWTILGTRTGAPEIESPASTYDEEVNRLRDWIQLRLSWLDRNMIGTDDCNTSTESNITRQVVKLVSNPVIQHLRFHSEVPIKEFILYNQSGQIALRKHSIISSNNSFNISHLKPGFYLMRVLFENNTFEIHKVIIQK